MRPNLWVVFTVLTLCGCDPVCTTTVRVAAGTAPSPGTMSVRADGGVDHVAYVVRAVADRWGFESRQIGDDFPPKDPNMLFGYSLDYVIDPAHEAHSQIYLTVSQPPRSGEVVVRLLEFPSGSESELKATIRRDLIRCLRREFGPAEVRASGCGGDETDLRGG